MVQIVVLRNVMAINSSSYPWHSPILPAAINFASHCLAETVLSKYNLYMGLFQLTCVTHTVGCTSVAYWPYDRGQDGHFGEKRLEQMFPVLERPICLFQRCVYLTQDGGWQPLNTTFYFCVYSVSSRLWNVNVTRTINALVSQLRLYLQS